MADTSEPKGGMAPDAPDEAPTTPPATLSTTLSTTLPITLAPVGGAALDTLRARHASGGALDLAGLLHDPQAGRIALVSSFGTESAALLHVALRARPDLDVVHIDTGRHFPETLAYRDALRERLGFRLVTVRPDGGDLARLDPRERLADTDPDACCHIRKTVPLARALGGYDGWLTGRKRMHGGARGGLPHLERDRRHLKINPLAHWGRAEVTAWMDMHDLPRHPLEGRGYASVGCEPCTRPTAPGEGARAGRWAGTGKTECGIHWGADGRPGAAAMTAAVTAAVT